ncbi:MAG: hypothetical protein LBG27_00475 [Spirochaetaceae bacterium]|nr:hypothetical protein [Spirochaetaceae bacterium]
MDSELFNPASPEYQKLPEYERMRRERLARANARMAARREAADAPAGEAKRALSETGGLAVSENDYEFIRRSLPLIEASEDKREIWERLSAASVYANNFGIPIETAYLDLEELHRQYAGRDFDKRGGAQAAIDSVEYSFEAAGKNWLAIQYHGEKDPEQRARIAEQIRGIEAEMERLKDKAPKVWDDAYVSQGAFSDLALLGRNILTATGENAVPLASALAIGAVTGDRRGGSELAPEGGGGKSGGGDNGGGGGRERGGLRTGRYLLGDDGHLRH